MFAGASLEMKLVRSWNFRVSFEIIRLGEKHDFVYFSDLEQLAVSFWPPMYYFHGECSIQTALKLE